MVKFSFSIRRNGEMINFQISLPEIQAGYVTTSNIRPNWMTSSNEIMQFEGGESYGEFQKDCKKIIDFVNADHQDFENSMKAALFDSINNHIQRFGRLLYNDLLLYLDCWAHILNNTVLSLQDTRTAYSSILAFICQQMSEKIIVQHLFGVVPLSSTDLLTEIQKHKA